MSIVARLLDCAVDPFRVCARALAHVRACVSLCNSVSPHRSTDTHQTGKFDQFASRYTMSNRLDIYNV